ncbi:MAG: hypothetical protein CVU40_14585 [Chloroflexi bacterium HGW-Chloroflexi-2]|jgi:uncharacterized protein YukE|nr:MAG: hypothetical protein CVU40_14585 [Chloroflexi bacterium HGW-Chloroflexi-2]
MNFILKLVYSAVDGVMSQIKKLLNQITSEITSPLRGMVQQVVGGVWKGDGATRFVQEMQTLVIPALLSLVGINTSFVNALQKSTEIFRNADKQATSKANELLDIFGGIYK